MSALQVVTSFFRGGALANPAPPPPAPPAIAEADSSAAAADATDAANAPTKRAKLLAKVAGFAHLTTDDFDGGGRTAEQIDIDNALAFIPHIPDRAAATVQVCTTGDGEIVFTWDGHPKYFFAVSFDDGGEMCFYGDLPSGRGVGADEAQYDKSAPPPAELLRLMSSLTF